MPAHASFMFTTTALHPYAFQDKFDSLNKEPI